MEHLHKLFVVLDGTYDMLLFCDDDDTYNETRVEMFINAFEHGAKQFENGFGGVREFKTSLCEVPEYWAYGVIPDVMKEFFNRFDKEKFILLKHKFGDMYLKSFLRRTEKYKQWIGITCRNESENLYNYNMHNPNSICATLIKEAYDVSDIYDGIVLEIIKCQSNDKFEEIINKVENKLAIVHFTHIYEFCKLLYK